jgi:tetratricopeptide (TPR) repeat protein
VVEIKPDLYEIYVDIAEINLIQNEDLNGALTMANTALKAYHGYSRGHEIKGRILLAKGKKDEAKKELKKALKYDPDNSSAKKYLNSIQGKKKPDDKAEGEAGSEVGDEADTGEKTSDVETGEKPGDKPKETVEKKDLKLDIDK